ncbi:hypothetical protein MBLNU230_g8064t1 [Neophaeotheca triangularis]
MPASSTASSSASSRSRNGSIANGKAQHGETNPIKTVQFGREHRPSLSVDGSRRSSNAHDHRRGSRSIDLLKEEDHLNEHSPLLAATERADNPKLPPLEPILSPSSVGTWEDDDPQERERQETKSSGYLLLLTLAIGGLQIAWSVELSNGSPYLLGLGISKSLLAFVWIAGPLSGTLVQPYVGIKSDRSRSRFGKRRPFMVGGAAATIISLMFLAWTREIVAGFLSIFGAAPDAPGVATCAIVFAILMIYVLDFSINVIQAGVRAFIVDNAPTHQQDEANAWASRVSGVGNILGYLSGYVNLPKYMWFFGDTQFKVLCVIASFAMIITLGISCAFVHERDPRLEGEPTKQEGGVIAFFKSLYHSIRKLPPQIRKVCQVQFFAWIGWFPFLFYITTYIGEIYVEPFFAENPNMTPAEVDATWEHATRIGTFALLIFAITTFAASVFLPMIVASTYKPPAPPLRTPMTPGARTPRTPPTPVTPGTRDRETQAASGYFGYNPANTASQISLPTLLKNSKTKPLHSQLTRLRRFLPPLELSNLTLRRAWFLSHLLFALLMWTTLLVTTTTGGTILVALVGIPWAMTNWAPFALIAAEISKRDAIRRGHLRPPPPPSTNATTPSDDVQAARDAELLARGEDPSDGADQAGVVLGIHNVAIAAPQVIATLVSSVIFRYLQKPRGSVGDESVAWVLRFGGCAAVVAAWFTLRVGEDGSR